MDNAKNIMNECAEWINNEILSVKEQHNVYAENLLYICLIIDNDRIKESIYTNRSNLILATSTDYIESIEYTISHYNNNIDKFFDINKKIRLI